MGSVQKLLAQILMGASDANIRYEIIIFWSEEDKSFVADVPELPGCMAHGRTYESALSNARDAIALWVKTAKEFKDPVPQPKGHRLVYA
jgi:predicted RNase H-like HicB family nuclease